MKAIQKQCVFKQFKWLVFIALRHWSKQLERGVERGQSGANKAPSRSFRADLVSKLEVLEGYISSVLPNQLSEFIAVKENTKYVTDGLFEHIKIVLWLFSP